MLIADHLAMIVNRVGVSPAVRFPRTQITVDAVLPKKRSLHFFTKWISRGGTSHHLTKAVRAETEVSCPWSGGDNTCLNEILPDNSSVVAAHNQRAAATVSAA